TTGRVILGAAKLVRPEIGEHCEQLMAWADERRRLRVRANADTPADAKRARELGAEGIGLCRTEHMFFEGDRITAMREMIVAPDESGRRRALAKLLPMQRADFEGIFEAMAGYPVTIRLLDPPLHEFLPHTREEIAALAKAMKVSAAELQRLVGSMIELPRAALTADEIAKQAEFFSFGTNDLTQTTFGLSRDDAGRFLPFYVEHGILKEDPFQVLDQEGVGKLIEIAVRLGRGTRSDRKIGICGEHGGEPSSVKFFHHAGVNYASCSP